MRMTQPTHPQPAINYPCCPVFMLIMPASASLSCTCRLLIDKGVNVDAQDANGHTALHIAALLNHGHVVPMLLHGHEDTSLVDNRGKTAEQLALDKQSEDVTKQFSVLRM